VRGNDVDEYTHETDRLKVSGRPSDLRISYTREKPFVIFFILALFALKPIFVAWGASDPYLRLAAVLILAPSLYAGLALAFDRTTIRAVGKRLTVRHGPLPLLRGAGVDSDEIRSLHCEERRVRAARYYKLDAELLDGRRVKLLSPVPGADDAQYACAALRGWLEAAGGL
jgi:hypothetical protein